MHQLEARTLDDPTGISKLMDSDPYNPMNRTTSYEKIPNAITNLSEAQFKHIIDTYRNLQPEIQPLGDAAIATLKAHYGDKLMSEGMGRPESISASIRRAHC
ncbi:hypothetical protein [Collimonas antrihumi]|uniref:hypothetical protein n=1 Tax=Collimonas antrihumi TaxID=1940615 RepID=UPI001B8D6F21|nr:hypothetical protein [Collimonas antrihumi]